MPTKASLALILATLAAVVAACDDSSGGGGKGTPSASASQTAAATTSAKPAASPTPSVASAAPTDSTLTEPAPTGSVAIYTGDAGGPTGEGVCGAKGQPYCPLQGWMKQNISGPSNDKDFPKLEAALTKIVTFAPAGYTNWVSIAKDGAAAAKKQDMDGVKASCRTCHKQYQDKYRAEMRTRKI